MINNTLENALRALATQSVMATNPTDIVLGEVVSESPLEIKLSDKIVLDESMLLLSDSVRDYEVDITVSHTTENRSGGGGYAEFASHNHGYAGRKKIVVHNALKVGEKVALIQASGGQLFFVASRIFAHTDVHGQWG